MKKLLFVISFVFLLMPFSVDAKEVNFYLFYGDGCPHCQALKEYLNKEYADDKDVNLYKYEVSNSSNDKNRELWQKVQDVTGVEARGVPYFIIGDEVFQGYNAGKTWENKVDNAIRDAKKNDYHDNVGIVLGVVDGKIKENPKDEVTSSFDPSKKEVDRSQFEDEESFNDVSDSHAVVDFPIVGTVDLKDTAIPVIAIIMGLVDGFNPCAMWILIFLITMLFDYPSRKKMWILGCTFLFTSAFIYFLFMISFLNIAMFMNTIPILKLIISLFALGFGAFNIFRFFKTKDAGCDVVNKDKRKKIMVKIKDILNEKKFILTLVGIVFLAVSVNLIELFFAI